MHHFSIPDGHKPFFDAIVEVFKRFPEVAKNYSIACDKQTAKLLAQKKDNQVLVSRLEGNRIVVELVDGDDSKLTTMGCCKYCVDDDGNTYCCISGDDC